MDNITNAAYVWVANDKYLYDMAMEEEYEEDFAEQIIDFLLVDSNAPGMLRDLLEHIDWYAIHKAVRDE